MISRYSTWSWIHMWLYCMNPYDFMSYVWFHDAKSSSWIHGHHDGIHHDGHWDGFMCDISLSTNVNSYMKSCTWITSATARFALGPQKIAKCNAKAQERVSAGNYTGISTVVQESVQLVPWPGLARKALLYNRFLRQGRSEARPGSERRSRQSADRIQHRPSGSLRPSANVDCARTDTFQITSCSSCTCSTYAVALLLLVQWLERGSRIGSRQLMFTVFRQGIFFHLFIIIFGKLPAKWRSGSVRGS